MKTLKTTELNIFLAWINLKNTPPQALNTIDQMERVSSIIKTLASAIPELIKLHEKGVELQKTVGSENFQEKEAEYVKQSAVKEEQARKTEIDVSFEDAEFNEFFQQEESKGKFWFKEIDEYLAFRKDMVVTNGQPKGSKAK